MFLVAQGFGQEFSSSWPQYGILEAGTCRSNRFVRAPFSGGGSNVPRPALSVPHLSGIRYVGRSRQARSAKICILGSIRPSYSWILACMQSLNEKNFLGGIRPSYSWILAYAELERKKTLESIYLHVGIVSKIGFLFRPHNTFFTVTPRSVWPIIVRRLLCRCFSISDFTVKFLCSSVVSEGERSLPHAIITPSSVRADSSS